MREKYDFLQDKVNFLQDRVNELKAEKKLLKDQYKQFLVAHDVLIEKRNELQKELEFIESGLPQPCTFDGKRNTSEYTFEDWLKKLKEEVAEVEVEVEKLKAKGKHHIDDITEEEDIENLTEELHDVITLATSELDYLRWSIYGRLQKQMGVNEKNKRRGYWNEI